MKPPDRRGAFFTRSTRVQTIADTATSAAKAAPHGELRVIPVSLIGHAATEESDSAGIGNPNVTERRMAHRAAISRERQQAFPSVKPSSQAQRLPE